MAKAIHKLGDQDDWKIILKIKKEFKLPYITDADLHTKDVAFLQQWELLKKDFPEISLQPLFTALPIENIQALVVKAMKTDPTYKPVDFSKYFYSTVSPNINIQSIFNLKQYDLFEAIDLQKPSIVGDVVFPLGNPYFNRQDHLKPAPDGVDAAAIWAETGGSGEADTDANKIKFIDLERGWYLDHEDLGTDVTSLLYGSNYSYREHGTNVMGVVGATDNTIGCIGIAPKCKKYAVGCLDNGGREITQDSILFAINELKYGDVLLIELQVSGSLTPIEEFIHFRDVIRLGTALGVVIIALGGNGNNNLDTYRDYYGNTIFNTSNTLFVDTGAILVGGVDSRPTSTTVAGSRAAAVINTVGSNYGSRINCFARFNNIITTGLSDYDLENPTVPPLAANYTSTFNGTSGASAIIAGVVVAIQSFLQAYTGRRLNSWQMRKLISDPLLGTASADPRTDKVGVMPDLRKIINSIKYDAFTDVYVRDNIDDNGDRYTGAISVSPDVITLNGTLAADILAARDQQTRFGAGSPGENSNNLSHTIRQGTNNYIYIRVKNRGTADALQVKARVYYSEVSTLITPFQWKYIGETTIDTVPAGDILTVSDPIIWNDLSTNPVPASGHYCYICIIGNDQDPMPLILTAADAAAAAMAPVTGTEIITYTWDQFCRLIRDNNNITWRNFNVINDPLPTAGILALMFRLNGMPEDEGKFDLDIVHDFPAGFKVILEFPVELIRLFQETGNKVLVNEGKASIEFSDANLYTIQRLSLPADLHAACTVKILILNAAELSAVHQVSIVQSFHHTIVGRIQWEWRNNIA